MHPVFLQPEARPQGEQALQAGQRSKKLRLRSVFMPANPGPLMLRRWFVGLMLNCAEAPCDFPRLAVYRVMQDVLYERQGLSCEDVGIRV